jgi:hypothetical protein
MKRPSRMVAHDYFDLKCRLAGERVRGLPGGRFCSWLPGWFRQLRR